MLIKHKTNVSPKFSVVNKVVLGSALTAITLVMPLTANAFSYNDTIKQSEVKVRIKLAELTTPEGVAAVYSKLERKAARSCAAGIDVDSEGNRISKESCAKNLITQWVSSSGIESLYDFHMASKGA